MNTELTDYQPSPSRAWSARPWLTAAGIALIVACLVPPLSVLARRYLFVESIQFCVFALAAPALIYACSGGCRRFSTDSHVTPSWSCRRRWPWARPASGSGWS